jgi:hypothetical protein
VRLIRASGVSCGAYFVFSVAVVVRDPSLCCVVVLLLDSPVDGLLIVELWLDAPLEGFAVVALVLFCPSGFSVVVELDVVCANAPAESATVKPRTAAVILNVGFMDFLLVAIPRGLPTVPSLLQLGNVNLRNKIFTER